MRYLLLIALLGTVVIAVTPVPLNAQALKVPLADGSAVTLPASVMASLPQAERARLVDDAARRGAEIDARACMDGLMQLSGVVRTLSPDGRKAFLSDLRAITAKYQPTSINHNQPR